MRLALMLGWIVWVGSAAACPNCARGLASKDRQATRSQVAYNTSIVVMAGMPFALTGFFGITFWRLSRQARPLPSSIDREDAE